VTWATDDWENKPNANALRWGTSTTSASTPTWRPSQTRRASACSDSRSSRSRRARSRRMRASWTASARERELLQLPVRLRGPGRRHRVLRRPHVRSGRDPLPLRGRLRDAPLARGDLQRRARQRLRRPDRLPGLDCCTPAPAPVATTTATASRPATATTPAPTRGAGRARRSSSASRRARGARRSCRASRRPIRAASWSRSPTTRSGRDPSDFVASASCVPVAGPGVTTSSDMSDPGIGGAFFYLVRATNACPRATARSARARTERPATGAPARRRSVPKRRPSGGSPVGPACVEVRRARRSGPVPAFSTAASRCAAASTERSRSDSGSGPPSPGAWWHGAAASTVPASGGAFRANSSVTIRGRPRALRAVPLCASRPAGPSRLAHRSR